MAYLVGLGNLVWAGGSLSRAALSVELAVSGALADNSVLGPRQINPLDVVLEAVDQDILVLKLRLRIVFVLAVDLRHVDERLLHRGQLVLPVLLDRLRTLALAGEAGDAAVLLLAQLLETLRLRLDLWELGEHLAQGDLALLVIHGHQHVLDDLVAEGAGLVGVHAEILDHQLLLAHTLRHMLELGLQLVVVARVEKVADAVITLIFRHAIVGNELEVLEVGGEPGELHRSGAAGRGTSPCIRQAPGAPFELL